MIKNDNILIRDIILFSEFLMKSEKDKTVKSKKIGKKSTKKRTKEMLPSVDDSDIIVIDDELKIDPEKELEERKAYLEEARSQDSSE